MSWEMKPLRELLSLQIGGVWGDPEGTGERNVRVIRVTELLNNHLMDTKSGVTRSVSEKQFLSRRLADGDLLLEKSGGGPNQPVGRVGLVAGVSDGVICSNFMLLMRPDTSRVLPRFLHLFLVYLHSSGKTIPLQTASTNIRNIKTDDYLDSKLPVPPLDEQKRIVAQLEDQLGKLEAVRADVASTKNQLEQLRASVLNSYFGSGTQPMKMRISPLAELVEILDRQRVPVSAEERRSRIGNVPYYGAMGLVGYIDRPLFDETLVLLGEDGVPFFDPMKSKAYLIEGPSWVNNHAHVLRVRSEVLDARYLTYQLNTLDYRGYVNGTTRLKLTQAAMKNLPISHPPLDDQRQIVQELDETQASLDVINSRLSEVDALVDSARSSILHRAFLAPGEGV